MSADPVRGLEQAHADSHGAVSRRIRICIIRVATDVFATGPPNPLTCSA